MKGMKEILDISFIPFILLETVFSDPSSLIRVIRESVVKFLPL